MPRHTYECKKVAAETESEIGLICLLKQGKPAGSSVTFVVYHDGAEKHRIDGAVVADPRARAGKAATAKYVPPLVPDDKTHYVVTYKAIADGEEYKLDDEIHVWPRKAKLTTRNEDDTKPLKNFKFKVMQGGAQTGSNLVTEGDDPATLEFKLEAGKPFTLEALDPYEFIGVPAAQNGKLRELKSTGRVNFTPEFVKPKRPGDGQIIQWVNMDADPALKGTDGLGDTVEVTVGVDGDRDPTSGNTITKPLGQAGIYVYVKVVFSGPGGKKSLRNTPKTELADGLNLLSRAAVKEAATDAQWEYTGKVDLALAGGVGKFKLALGLAGGDTCTVSLGSTPACNGPTLTFTNWRKRWYELMAPDFMVMNTRVVGGVSMRDFPAAGRTVITDSGLTTFTEYEIHKSFSFTELEATTAGKGSVLPREFFGQTSGPDKRYLLTRLTMQTPPKAFDNGKGSRCMTVLLCDDIFVSDGASKGHPDRERTITTTTAEADLDLATTVSSSCVWHPVSANRTRAAADTIIALKWTANIARPTDYQGPADYDFETDVDDPTIDGTSKDRRLRIEELTQNPAPCTVVFKNPLIGNTPTTLDGAAKSAINAWLASLWTDAKVRPHGFELRFRITGFGGNANRNARFDAVRAHIQNQMGTAAPQLYKHLGLTAAGACRTGPLDWAATVNMGRSHAQRIAVDLPAVNPDDPGSLAGALSDTQCPIDVYFKFEHQVKINGNANNPWVVIKLGTEGPAAPECVSETVMHEGAHRLGLAAPAHGVPGIPAAKKIDEADAVYPHNGTLGHYYTGHGHNGGHCAYGLSDAQKGTDPFNWTTSQACKCFLYGSGGRDDSSRRRMSFCPQCQDILRGKELT
ncbi:hypothetical protein [Rubrivivax rivuli]|uniref:Uncharacterized protein n=1 Tax=Rubrivivax rivuli TaxID=1862385 RepID=A0A437RIG8_9BURK|nr:hypothetical protein [Rubrivivax rivuli]RVU46505.1 hypothetical protein EOE66_11845 [Rubrivivax rivuli]